MQELVQSHGNIVQFSPKGHPEIAGAGIEFDWGVSKKDFRYNNNHIAKNCDNVVRSSLAKVTLQIAKNTASKARSYMQAYMDDSGGSHLLIEKFFKIHKCHRNILDQEYAWLERQLVKIDQHPADVVEERAFLAAEKIEMEGKTESKIAETEITRDFFKIVTGRLQAKSSILLITTLSLIP